eukprot:COSAG04_NODE_2720_length_3682_cov_1.276026_1_plen_335_part_10
MDTDLERAGWVAEHFGVDADACYAPDSLATMLAEQRPDVVCVVTPVMYMKSTILTCCEAGESVKGIQCEKPIGGRLSDADDMVAACDAAGIVFGGGNLQRCIPELQELAARIHAGTYGELIGASLHGFGGEIVGGGVQNLSVLRLLTGAEVTQVQAYRWVANEDDEAARDEARAAGHPKAPPEGLAEEAPFDSGANYSAQLTLSNGLTVAASPRAQDTTASAKNPNGFESVEGAAHGGVDVWSAEHLLRYDWPQGPLEYFTTRGQEPATGTMAKQSAPQIFSGFDDAGRRIEVEGDYAPYPWPEHYYLTASSRTLLKSIETGDSSNLFVSGHDLR